MVGTVEGNQDKKHEFHPMETTKGFKCNQSYSVEVQNVLKFVLKCHSVTHYSLVVLGGRVFAIEGGLNQEVKTEEYDYINNVW